MMPLAPVRGPTHSAFLPGPLCFCPLDGGLVAPPSLLHISSLRPETHCEVLLKGRGRWQVHGGRVVAFALPLRGPVSRGARDASSATSSIQYLEACRTWRYE